MKQIPPIDLTRQHELIEQELATAVLAVLKSGRYIGGTAVTDFEQQFANYIGVSECVGCNSGTDALYLALRALNIGQGDEVITTSFTFIATAEVITRVGAKPVFVDIEPHTFNLDLNLVEPAITERTKAIIPVHLFGQPIDMTRLMAIANQYNLYVIEDCAQAIGAEWQDQKVGSIGHIGCFSFFPTKNLGACGDAGALTTSDRHIAAQVKLLREHGLDRSVDNRVSYSHLVTGLNSRLDALQATILQIKLRYLEEWNQQRIEAAQYYQQILQPLPALKLPQTLPEGKSVWNQYTIRIPDLFNQSELTRDLIRAQLGQMGVIAMVYYPLPLHLQPVYQPLGYQKGQLPVCEQVAQEVLSLPLFPGIETEEQQQVVYCLKDCLSFLPNHF
ncbi:MAG: DegT/DnrJ/EryC1/StrS family aminotransferase [Stanieria sp.]